MKSHKPRGGRKPGVKGPPQTDWGGVAEWYDALVGDEGSEYHREVVHPGLIRLLRVKKGERVLDVGCGQGAWCRVLHSLGAKPTGVDAAKELLVSARERSDPAIPFYLGDARELRRVRDLQSGSFDTVTIVMSIQNLDPIGPVFEGAAWALAPGGRVLIVMMHPAFRGTKYTSWGWEGHESQYRRVDRYLLPRKEPIITHPGKKDGAYTWTYHRPIQSYTRALHGAGFAVEAMEEWASHKKSGPGPRAVAENRARGEIPMFMAILAVRGSAVKTNAGASCASGGPVG